MVSIALGVMAVTWSAGLLSERLPSGVRLLDDDDAAPAASSPPRRSSSLIGPGELEAMSGPELQNKYEALRADRPGVGGAVAALVLGNVLPVIAVFIPSSPVLALVLVGGGLLLSIVGTVVLIVNIVGMARYGHAMRLVRDEIALRALPRPPPSAPALVAPPPAPEEKRPAAVEPAPPEGALPRLEPRLLLAVF